MITIKNISFNYDDIPALNNITLSISEGDSVAIIGPNGSGKSTLLKLINGLVFAADTKGNNADANDKNTDSRRGYFFNGQHITEKYLSNINAARTFHSTIGFVFQNPETQLFCSSVYEEVAFAPMQMGMNEEQTRLKVKKYLELLGIQKLSQRVPYFLSEGEKKKVALASVLVMEPKVLVLDEPMNGIDPKTKRFISELLVNLNREGKTIICATHDFEYVKGVFKRAVVLSENKTVIFDAQYDALMKDEPFLYANNLK
ncbi:MAG: ABC transporter ATP-binding protein [Pseudomonadota bacterium]